MIQLNVSEHGFDRVERVLSNATSESLADTLRGKVLRALATEYVERVKAAILAGEAQGPGLAPATIARKGHGTPWIDKTDLINALEARPIGKRWHGGIPETAKNRRGEPLDLIALVLEIGSLRIPARPLFGPTLEEMRRGRFNATEIRAEIGGALKQALG